MCTQECGTCHTKFLEITRFQDGVQKLYQEFSQNGDYDVADELLQPRALIIRRNKTTESLNFTYSRRKAWNLLRKLGGAITNGLFTRTFFSRWGCFCVCKHSWFRTDVYGKEKWNIPIFFNFIVVFVQMFV